MQKMQRIAALAMFLFAICLFTPLSDVSAKEGEGEGGGEEVWIDVNHYHYEYVPYVNGMELPRTVYRHVGALGFQNVSVQAGDQDFKFTNLRNKRLNNKVFESENLMYMDSFTVNRSDVFIFCDFAIEHRRQYIIEEYPYRHHHFHYVYYETPVSIAGFGLEGTPTFGGIELRNLYLTRDYLDMLVGDFDINALVPSAEKYGAEPHGKKTLIRQWGCPCATGSGTDYHYSYVWELDKTDAQFGFWTFFDTTKVATIEFLQANKESLSTKTAREKAREMMEEMWNTEVAEHPKEMPNWIKDYLDSKPSVGIDSVLDYELPFVDRSLSRDIFRMDVDRLDEYFVDVRDILSIYESAYGDMALEVAKRFANGDTPPFVFSWGVYDGTKFVPLWGESAFDVGYTSTSGTWTVFDKHGGGRFFAAAISNNPSRLAHWLFGAASAKVKSMRVNENAVDSLASSGNDATDWETMKFNLSGQSNVSLKNSSDVASVIEGIYENGNLLAYLIKEGLGVDGTAADAEWPESFLRNNPTSPWNVLAGNDGLQELYDMIVPFSSLSLGLTFLDAADSTAWTRGIRFEAQPTYIATNVSNKPISLYKGEGFPEEHIEGINTELLPDYSDTKKNPEAALDMLRNWSITSDGEARHTSANSSVMHAVSNYFPVDLDKADGVRTALENYYKATLEKIEDDVLDEMLWRFFGEKTPAPEGFGLGEYSGSASKKFDGAAYEWLPSWDMVGRKEYVPYESFGKDSFGWSFELPTWNPPVVRANKVEEVKED